MISLNLRAIARELERMCGSDYTPRQHSLLQNNPNSNSTTKYLHNKPTNIPNLPQMHYPPAGANIRHFNNMSREDRLYPTSSNRPTTNSYAPIQRQPPSTVYNASVPVPGQTATWSQIASSNWGQPMRPVTNPSTENMFCWQPLEKVPWQPISTGTGNGNAMSLPRNIGPPGFQAQA